MFDVEALLAPVSDDKPVGPDLEYDPDFIALETAARGKPEQQYGATVIPAEEPDWDDVYNRAEALLGRTKDLRVAVLLARAATRRHNSEGLAAGLRLVREMLTRYWDSVHPYLDHDDHDRSIVRGFAHGDPCPQCGVRCNVSAGARLGRSRQEQTRLVW